jgi:hypothetical protein
MTAHAKNGSSWLNVFSRVRRLLSKLFKEEGNRMLAGWTPDVFLRFTLLLAIRDGSDRVVFRPIDEYSCEEFAWTAGEQQPMIPPSLDDLQALPAELARLETSGVRWLRRLTRWFRRSWWGSFEYPVGPGVVPVAYRVHWAAGRVAELDITIGRVPELAGAAQAGLLALFPPDLDGLDC